MSMDLNRIKIALELLDEKERQEALTEAGKQEEPQLSLWQKIQQSKHFDFLKKIAFTAVLFVLLHFSWIVLEHINFLPESANAALFRVYLSGVIFLFISIFIDFFIYVSETVYYDYLKRNGNRTFDNQEDIKHIITPWQKILISNLKPLFYFLLFVLIYQAT
jgi:hypothetical protein